MHGTGKRENPEVFICFYCKTKEFPQSVRANSHLKMLMVFFRREKRLSLTSGDLFKVRWEYEAYVMLQLGGSVF
ncbi:hypothetical protein BIZ35_15510 [Heyndrickxia coagulans]|nr:hypothetical protein BIZ35_15510 [Heyndrickxia coagulans]